MAEAAEAEMSAHESTDTDEDDVEYMSADEYMSDDDWTDLEDEEVDSDSDKDGKAKAKKAKKGDDESEPLCMLPIGMASVLWRHFGFPVREEGCAFLPGVISRKFVVCAHCQKVVLFGPRVTEKMGAHLRDCHAKLLKKIGVQLINAPMAELKMLPNVMVDDKKADKIDSRRRTLDDWKSTKGKEPECVEHLDLAIRQNRLNDAAFGFGIEILNLDFTDEFSFQALFEVTGCPCKMPESLADMLSSKYELVKEKVKASLADLPEYSLSVEEWLHEDEIKILTFSVNYLDGKELYNCILMTRPKYKPEMEMHLKDLFEDWGLQKDKISAVVSNSNIDLRKYFEFDPKTQFVPCFLSVLASVVKNELFSLAHLKVLLDTLELKFTKQSDFEDIFYALKSRKENAKGWGLQHVEKSFLGGLVQVLAPLLLCQDLIAMERPASLVSIIWPMLDKLQKDFLRADLEKDEPEVFEMKKLLMDALMEAYQPVLPFLQTATLLDPRFRLLDCISESPELKGNILHDLESIMDKKEDRQAEVEYVANFRTEQPLDFLISPLIWWQQATPTRLYPNLKTLARRYNCIPSTCIPPGRLNADLHDPQAESYYVNKRSQLDLMQADKMLFLRSNQLKYKM